MTQIMQKRGPGRPSRDQQTREAQGVEIDDSFLFEESGPLPNIPARPGYAQRWGRVKYRNENDGRNILRLQQRGWKPRPADTVPVKYQGLTVQNASLGGVIGTDDSVLMERPIELQARVEAHQRHEVDSREQAVKRNVFRDYQAAGGADTGFTQPVHERSEKVERGVPVLLDDD